MSNVMNVRVSDFETAFGRSVVTAVVAGMGVTLIVVESGAPGGTDHFVGGGECDGVVFDCVRDEVL